MINITTIILLATLVFAVMMLGYSWLYYDEVLDTKEKYKLQLSNNINFLLLFNVVVALLLVFITSFSIFINMFSSAS